MNKRPAYAAQPRGLPPKLVAPPAVPHETRRTKLVRFEHSTQLCYGSPGLLWYRSCNIYDL